jgi:hypothetical protein
MVLSSFGEAIDCSATQGFPNILRTPTVHYRLHLS